MSENKLVVIDSVAMIENAFVSIEAMEVFCAKVLESKLAPDHFYPKLPDGKTRDYTKGNTAAVMMVLMQGRQLGLPAMTSLQHIIPVNGLLSVKGDAAKSMIFSSGKLKKDSWKEEQTGSIQSEDLAVKITATREDNGETLTRSFSVEEAKRAGLWVTQQMVAGADGWKHKKSAWYKYPQRMVTYRALGFIARDLFPDVLSGIYTTEEAIDMPEDTTTVIEAKETQIVIPDKGFNQERSNGMTSRAVNQIDKLQEKDPHKLYPATPEESSPAPEPDPQMDNSAAPPPTCEVMLNGTPGLIPVYGEKDMMEMSSASLMSLVEQDGLMARARDLDPTKNTNKKLRNIILAKYSGNIMDLIVKFDPEDGSPAREVPPPTPPVEEANEAENVPHAQDTGPGTENPVPEPEASVPGGNKFGIEVAELDESGSRSFDVAKTLFEELSNVAGLDNDVYMAKAESVEELQAFKDREEFVFKASKQVIDGLLNTM